MVVLLLLVLSSAAVTASTNQRIIGGEIVDISTYRFAAALLYTWRGNGVFTHACGGTILTDRAILSAAHCVFGDYVNQWRTRLGSTRASSGGSVYNFDRIIIHPRYDDVTVDNDIAILRTSTSISFGANITRGRIAGANYAFPDNTPVWAIGWGLIRWSGASSDQLRHVQVWTVNQDVCRQRYAELSQNITDNMMCSGWLDVGGRDACTGDSGGPLLHNNVVIGVTSWGKQCALSRYPGVNVLVSRFSNWIKVNV